MQEREVYIRGVKPKFRHLEFALDSLLPAHHQLLNQYDVEQENHKQILRTGMAEVGLPVTNKNELRFFIGGPSILFLVIILVIAVMPKSSVGPATYILLLFGCIIMYVGYMIAATNYMKTLAFNSEAVLAYYTDWENFIEIFVEMGKLHVKSWPIADIESITVFRQKAPSATKLIQKESLSLEMQVKIGDQVVNRQLFGSPDPISTALHLPFYELSLQKLGQVIGIMEDKLKVVELEYADTNYIVE